MFILRESSRDWLIVLLVGLLVVGVNLPDSWTHSVNIDRRYFLAGLIAIIGFSLVRYLKFTLILIVVFLAIGANLPRDLAQKFGIEPNVLVLALITLVVLSLANRVLNLPTGLEKPQGSQGTRGGAALFNAVLNGHLPLVIRLLDTGANINVSTINGSTPLMVAAHKGHVEIVQTLIMRGANVNAVKTDGSSALNFAERAGFTRCADLLRVAMGQLPQTVSEAAEAKAGTTAAA